jgi:predicted Rossmann-fold nucleotide-binding protein
MGLVALSARDYEGEIIGIMPEALVVYYKEFIGETIIVQDMHARKKKMSEYADAFIALPG